MKIFYAFLILSLFQNCSFDNKTGIWKNENSSITKKDKNLFEEFETMKVLEIRKTIVYFYQ